MKFGVVVFPGSNCDHDAYHALHAVADQPATFLWHESENLGNCDAIIIPGGFSYGDYLRTGAIARFSPVMQSVRKFAAGGGLVLGICNGFQILCESGLLPGALLRNAGLRYICKQIYVRTETTHTPFTQALSPGQVLKIPIGHMEGNYFCEPETLSELERAGRIAFRYCTQAGEVTSAANPNGSISGIAGVLSEGKNVLGMMPHPDRSSEGILGSSDGLLLFRSLAGAMTR
ncbi:MAG TPA: phosphoribosylformylglycinamidine synthase subunit PurQ [Acidobacteriaceae bacterium]|nr:phosphoribosylformylglycinamidine synthase subunit PurQ [Acidobacteriaceae bacterium]